MGRSAEPSGRITTEGGELIGVASGRAPIVDAAVIVAPSAGKRERRDVYREMPFVARRDVALGSHAVWRDVTRRRLRDARALAIVGVACSAAAVVAKMLGA